MSQSMRGFQHRTTHSRSPSRPMRRWKRRKLKNEEQSAGDDSILCSRSVHASTGLYPVVQNLCTPLTYPCSAFARRHQK
nr:hypothetical protein [Ochrobactrum sp. POC9]